MLNKLLKRCMPWQQNGKWVRIYFDGLSASETNEIVFRSSDDLTISVEDEWSLTYTSNRPISMEYTSMHLTITHANSGLIPNTNTLFGDFTPSHMLGVKGFIDVFVTDIEVI